MIRKMEEKDISAVMQIWFETNIKAHNFITKAYWTSNYEMVKQILPEAEVYVYEEGKNGQIDGFIGINDCYIEGLFVKESAQSMGIGKCLLDYVKSRKTELRLCVYEKNMRAIRFYQRENFRIQAEGTDEDTNEKEYVMRWGK
jgi:putative acetyltransferase